MALGGSANSLDILIETIFSATGLEQASKSLASFASQVTKLNTSLGTLTGTQDKTTSSVTRLGTGYSGYLNYLSKTTSGISEANTGYSGYLKNINEVRNGISNLTEKTTYLGKSMTSMVGNVKSSSESLNTLITSSNSAGSAVSSLSEKFSTAGTTMVSTSNNSRSAFGLLTEGVTGGISKMGGYFSGLIKQTISVGDIFGFYIGMQALQAVYDLTIGVSSLRNEMETTFEYMGYGTQVVEDFSNSLMQWAVDLPKMSIAGANEIARVVTMAGVSLDEFKSKLDIVGDIQAVAVSLTGLSADAASSKVATALADAVSGNYKRLQNIMGVSVDQFKAKAAELGFAEEDLVGNYTNTMTVLEALMGERGLIGVSQKLTSFTDVWAYFIELLSYKGSQVGDWVIPILIPMLTEFGNILNAIPIPIFAVMLAFTGLIGAILVGLPIVASLVTSFGIVKTAAEPLVSPIRNLINVWNGYSNEVKASETILANWANTAKATTVTVGELQSNIYGVTNGIKGTKLSQLDMDYKTTTRVDPSVESGVSQYARMGGGVTGWDALSGSVDNFTKKIKTANAEWSILCKNDGSGWFSRLKSGLSNGTSGFMNFIKSILSCGRAFLTLMLTNPIGWILLIVAAIITLITVTDSWGAVLDLLGQAWDGLVSILQPLIDLLKEWVNVGIDAIANWSGWQVIAQWITDAADALKTFLEYMGQITTSGGKEGLEGVSGALQPLSDGFTYATDSTGKFFDQLIFGKNEFATTQEGIVGTTLGLLSLMSPLTLVTLLWQNYDRILSEVNKEWKKFSESPEGIYLLAQLRVAIIQAHSAWAEFKEALAKAWAELRGPLDQLRAAIYGLKQPMDDLNNATTDSGNKAEDTGRKWSLVTLIIEGLKIGIRLAIIVIKIFSWTITNVLIPAIDLVMPFLRGLLLIFSWIASGVRILWPLIQKLGLVFGGSVSHIMLAYNALKRIYCIIVGCSPGIIPAITLLIVTAQNLFPLFAQIVMSSMYAALGYVLQFISRTVVNFGLLPGRILKSIWDKIRAVIMKEINNAYNGAVSLLGKFYTYGHQIKDKVVSGIMDAFGIESPSKVTGSLGEMIAQGLYLGMTHWLDTHIDVVITSLKGNSKIMAAALAEIFKSFNWVFYYYDSLQSVTQTLSTMTGNCSEAADAFIYMANAMGLAAVKTHTYVNGIGHYVVTLPGLGMWLDPSGILGTGLKTGSPAGSYAGAPVTNVYVTGNNIKDDTDEYTVGRRLGQRVTSAWRFGK